MEYCLDLTPFYENTSIKTLLNGSIIEIPAKAEGSEVDNPKAGSYVVERWMKKDSHCLVFICISPGKHLIFGAKPSHVKMGLKSNKIFVIKQP